MAYFQAPIKDRILSKIVIDDAGCWNWIGSLDQDGYGSIGIIVYGKQYKFRAHRVSFEEFKSKLTKDLYVLHTCNNRKCVNPDHLYEGTQKENCQDTVNSGNSLKGERSKRSILKQIQVDEIRQLLDSGVSGSVLADRFGVHSSTICAIKMRRNWK
jgi:hypothetical protein